MIDRLGFNFPIGGNKSSTCKRASDAATSWPVTTKESLDGSGTSTRFARPPHTLSGLAARS